MTDSDFEKAIWSLANTITAFAIAQGVGFALVLGTTLKQVQEFNCPAKMGIALAIAVFTLAYSLAVSWCCRKGLKLNQNRAHLRRGTNVGRIVAIVLFSLLDVVALFAG